MKKNTTNNIVYSDEAIKLGRIVRDFLPKPEELSFKEKKTKITITITQRSLDFFKSSAKKYGASYQAMIRRLIDHYVVNQKI